MPGWRGSQLQRKWYISCYTFCCVTWLRSSIISSISYSTSFRIVSCLFLSLAVYTDKKLKKIQSAKLKFVSRFDVDSNDCHNLLYSSNHITYKVLTLPENPRSPWIWNKSRPCKSFKINHLKSLKVLTFFFRAINKDCLNDFFSSVSLKLNCYNSLSAITPQPQWTHNVKVSMANTVNCPTYLVIRFRCSFIRRFSRTCSLSMSINNRR